MRLVHTIYSLDTLYAQLVDVERSNHKKHLVEKNTSVHT